MPQATIFRWPSGLGWLVLSGGGPLDSDDNTSIEAAVLTRTVSQGPLAYIWAASDLESADRHMDLLSDLGARTGYLVDVLTEDDSTLFRQLSEAGIIILGDGPRQETLRDALAGSALRGIEEAFVQGATIYAVGASATLLGAYVVEDGELKPGYRWLEHAAILPGYTAERAEFLHGVVQQVPDGYGLGLGHGAALAFGPLGEVEVWGNQAITITLGKNYA
ncbi:MAG: hypothetical protein EHM39_03970 [Chloroflexi bacterium]|nr:MAG: hypothetical protein EHM39_03970 [Chloroflexota bacterium]